VGSREVLRDQEKGRRMTDYLPCQPDQWLFRLAEGWRFADWIVDFTEWNAGWPVVLLTREA
jgi:hypothetical protein